MVTGKKLVRLIKIINSWWIRADKIGTATTLCASVPLCLLTVCCLLFALCCPLSADFTINGATMTLNNNVVVTSSGSVKNNGTLNCSSADIRLSANWENNGTFTAGTSTVTFTDSLSTTTITGNTTFYNFICQTAGKVMMFINGSTQTVAGTFTVNGTAGNLIVLRSYMPGSKWYINFNNPQTVNFVDVKDSNANNNTVTCNNSQNSGNNNANWVFPGGDTTVPTVAILQPTHNSQHTTLNTISGTAADNVAISTVAVSVKRINDNYYWNGSYWSSGEVWNGVNNLYTSSWTYTSLPTWVDGSSYTIVAKSQDTSSNWSTAYATSTWTYDIAKPTSVVTLPANGATIDSLTSISGTATDNVGLNKIEVGVKRIADSYYWAGGFWSASESWLNATGTTNWNYTSITGANLTLGTSYWILSRGYDNAGNIESSVVGSTFTYNDATAPGQVTGFTATTGAQVSLSWTAPGDDGYVGQVASGKWQVVYSSNPSASAQSAEYSLYKSSSWTQGNTYSEIITGLKPRTTYYFWIKARDEMTNNWSVWSDSAVAISDSFVMVWNSPETEVTEIISWGDYDNDGDLDILAGNWGLPNRVYRNNGDGTFSNVWNSPETENTNSVSWGDYDNDGDLDQLVGNYGQTNRVYRNNGDGTFTSIWNSPETENSVSVSWGDYDNEGDLDQLVGSCYQPTRVYRNNGDGTFTSIWNSQETDNTRSVPWGDYDNDGDLDILVGNFGINRVYRNNGNGTFTNVWNSLESEQTWSISWGDYDNDGDLDQLVGNIGQPNRIYRNNGNGTFTNVWTSPETDKTWSLFWGDYDNDGDLDQLIGNDSQPNRVYKSLESEFGNVNSSPTAPTTGFSSTQQDGQLQMRWDYGTDTQTAQQKGLYYNVRIATEPITNNPKHWIVSPSTGAGMSPFMGNYSHGYCVASSTQPGLNLNLNLEGCTYYWQVRTIDTGLRASAWSTQQSTYVLFVPDMPTGFTVSSVNVSSITWCWNDNELYENGYRVKASTGGIIANLSANTTYYVESGLSVNTSYTRYVEVYNTVGSSQSSVVSCYTLAAVPTGTYIVSVTSSQIVTQWSQNGNPDGTNYDLQYSTANNFSIYSSSITQSLNLQISNLTEYTTYYLRVRSRNGESVYTDYSTTVSTRTKDGTSPTVAITQPTNNSQLSTLSSVTGTSADAMTGVLAVQVAFQQRDNNMYYNGSTFTSGTIVWLSPIGTNPWEKSITSLTSGAAYYAYAKAQDKEGNWSTVYSTITFTYDTEQPTAYLVQPTHNSQLSTLNSITGTAADNIAISTVQVRIQDLSNGQYWTGSGWDMATWLNATGTSNWSYSSVPTWTNNKQYNILVRANDTAGNVQSSFAVAISSNVFKFDNNGPNVGLTAPSQTYQNSLTQINGSATDAEGNTVSDVRISIKNLSTGKYYDGSGFNASSVNWLSAVLSSPWYYNTSDSKWSSGTQYEIVAKAQDASGNWSVTYSTKTFTFDNSAPAAVTDLTGLTGLSEGEIKLSWTSPGDDSSTGSLQAGSKFNIQYSTDSLSVIWNSSSAQVNISTSGVSAGTVCTYVVSGLTSAATYYFRLWTVDESSNTSGISNGVTTYAQYLILSVLINAPTSYNFGNLELNQSTVTLTEFTVKNDGTTAEKFGLRCSTVGTGAYNWGAGSAPAKDVFVLKAGFHSSQPSENSFGTEDIVYSTNTVSTDTVYSIDGTHKGNSVPISEQRKLWLKLQTPNDTSTISEQKIRVYITAEQQ